MWRRSPSRPSETSSIALARPRSAMPERDARLRALQGVDEFGALGRVQCGLPAQGREPERGAPGLAGDPQLVARTGAARG